MIVHFFTGKDRNSATARFRGYLVAEQLEKYEGFKVRIYPPPIWRSVWRIDFARIKEFVRHARFLFFVGRRDIIYLVRTVYQLDFIFLVLFARVVFRKKYIFDFDDAIYEKPWCSYRSRLLTRFATVVVVGNHHLRDWARSRNARVLILPTAVPFGMYQKYSRKHDDFPVVNIGWIGNGINHLKNLRFLPQVFIKLVEEGVGFRFVLIGALGHKPLYDLFADIPGVETELIDQLDWSEPESSPRAISRFDIGIMPLVSDKKTIGKSALKAIEYMACGIPPVISPVGENRHLVRDGQNGFLANSTGEWVEKLRLLAKDKNLRQRLGTAAQSTVRQGYSHEATLPKLIDMLREVSVGKI